MDEPEQKTDTISVPIPQCEESENIPLSDFPEQPENVQRPGSEVVEKGDVYKRQVFLYACITFRMNRFSGRQPGECTVPMKP